MRISDWSSDVCSSDLVAIALAVVVVPEEQRHRRHGLAYHQFTDRVEARLYAVVVGFDIDDETAALDFAGMDRPDRHAADRSEAHPSELQSIMRISYADF